jgi:creatinine amidohydrolase/Fe(II)-dependent formamide hydrolase-like protein
MLKAIGRNPKDCGYTDISIKSSLSQLLDKGIHQEVEGFHQLLFMLKQKGLLESAKKVRPSPQILNIRIDKKKSPLTDIPIDLRKPLLDIIIQHAAGIVTRVGNRWVGLEMNNIPGLDDPYPFETSKVSVKDLIDIEKENSSFLWGQLTWPEAESYLENVDIAILPVGAIEQHGPHLPLDTDSFDAQYLAHQVAAACSKPRPLVLPLVPYGVSYHHEGFIGTISINNNTLSTFIYEIGISLAQNGIKKILIINGHGGNSPSLNFAAQMINRDARIFVCVDSGETSDVDIYKLIETPNDVHAGEFETSTTLAVRPDLVKLSLAERSVPEFSNRYLNFTSKRGISWYAYTKRISENGIIGDPTKADAGKGKKMWQIMIGHLVSFVEELKHMSLEEIHQTRY